MKTIIGICLSMLLLATSAPSLAAVSGVTATVTYVTIYSDGKVLVMGRGFQFPGASCSNNGGFVIPASHAHRKELLALVLSARATGSALQVYAKIDNCWYPEISEVEVTHVTAYP